LPEAEQHGYSGGYIRWRDTSRYERTRSLGCSSTVRAAAERGWKLSVALKAVVDAATDAVRAVLDYLSHAFDSLVAVDDIFYA